MFSSSTITINARVRVLVCSFDNNSSSAFSVTTLDGERSRGSRFDKGGRSGMGTLHRLQGVTNGGRRGHGGPLYSPSPVPIP